jgi:hypothetical protein
VSISQTGRPTDDTFKCQAAHRGVDEPTDDPASRVNQGTELREEFEERPLRGAKLTPDGIVSRTIGPGPHREGSRSVFLGPPLP